MSTWKPLTPPPKPPQPEPVFQERSLDWEPIEGRVALDAHGVPIRSPHYVTYRLPVPGGWLVRTLAREGVALAFVPDPHGIWQPVSPLTRSGTETS